MVANYFNKKSYQYLLDEKKWVKINNFPQTVGGINGVFEINNALHVVGENGISTIDNQHYKLPPNENLDELDASCLVANDILVFGKTYNLKLESSLFNTANKRWSDWCKIETRREEFAAVEFQNKVWVVGGFGINEEGYQGALDTIQVHDPVKKTTFKSTVKMLQARKSHKVVAYNNKLFVFGGCCDYMPLNSVEMYSPETDKFVLNIYYNFI